MNLGFGFRQEPRLSQRLSLRQEPRLSHSQRLSIDTRLLQLQLDLVESLWGVKYKPQCKCHHCGHELTPLEILRGFSDDVTDTSVACPICLQRIRARLVAHFKGGRSELAFFCPSQTTDRLWGLEDLSYEELNRQHPILLHSANVHFGNISAAFAKNGVDYPLDKNVAWKEKVTDFLGLLPDGKIAEAVGTTRYQVCKLRKLRGIKGYKKRALLSV
jgi:hypothetical protein